MSEAGEAAAGPVTAGRLLREARERQGLHIAALAAAIKVVPRKLESLEADRLDELPDATFARALAQTVCRALKIDPAPVLRLLPAAAGHPLASVGEGLNAPFRERPGVLVQRDGASFASRPTFWIVALIIVATLALYLLPTGLFGRRAASPAQGASGSEAASAPGEAAPLFPPPSAALPGLVPEASAASALPAPSAGASSPAAALAVPGPTMPLAGAAAADSDAAPLAPPAADGVIQLQASAESWVVVTDANGHALVSRLLQPGETLGLDGAPPFKVRIGNASGTRLTFRGQPTDLAAYTRDNVARLELK